jgi:hypothetical protein
MKYHTVLSGRIKKSWKFEYYLLLGSIAVAFFYIVRLQLFGNPLALTNDNYALGYPGRILVSSSIQNGIFPLWDHWTHGGMPFSSPINLLSFSPIVLLLSLFGVYSISTFVVEILIIHILSFIGMYTWLTFYSSKFSSLVIAFCFAVMIPQILQTPLNFEAVVSTALLPWLGIGMKYCMREALKGIGIIAFSVWIMMTTGYLGMNVIFIELIVFFCISEAILLAIKNKSTVKQVLSGSLLIFCGLFIGGLIVNYPFVENFVHYGISFTTLRDATFTPYAASANLFSLFTLIFPNHIWAFSADEYLAHTGIIFFGSIPIYMALYSFFRRKHRINVILLMTFFILSFLAMLSTKYPFAQWISMNFPLLRYIRWHGWFLTASVFFLATVSSIGMTEYIDEKEKRLKIFVFCVFIILATLTAMKQSGSIFVSPVSYLRYPQTIIFILLGIIILVSNRKLNNLVYLLCVIEVVVVSWSIGLLGNNLYYRGLTNQEAVSRESVKQRTKYFPIISNERSIQDSHVNPQYYTKQPSLYGYNPVIYPTFASFISDPKYPLIMKYLFYPENTAGFPDINDYFKINSVRLTPNSAEATIVIQSNEQNIVWSSPYSSSWILSIDGVQSYTQPNRFGLTQFTINKGIRTIRFAYRPPYFIFSMLLAFSSIGMSVYLITKKSETKIGKRFNNNPGHRSI